MAGERALDELERARAEVQPTPGVVTGIVTVGLEPLVRERLWVVAPPSEGLRGDRPVPFARAAEHPLVIPAAGHGLRSLIDGADT
ncbi:LysR substrate-binding domain-containing protein [Streptomyces niphimycinicus]|uniref:LysR substrate-binding domain-containing protein n=1 Tax=Streptomyces niphimycinicus TaxID=2842201 RepID=UPI00209ADBA2|nr:LysR substrate-binding domain-containing protein [Streptomyces niphimycinicus]